MYIRKYTLFSTLHPLLLLLYALGAPITSMFSKSPLSLCISFFGALCVHMFYFGIRHTWNGVKFALPFFVIISALNMFLNPGGMTVLFRIFARDFTLESLCYGMANGAILCTVLLWFRCFTAVVPNDKFLYLFGKRFQTTALLLSMILKLFPETNYKIQSIRLADDTGQEEKGTVSSLKRALSQMSCLLEWSMEDSIETADAMKARAYGSGKRTSYEKYTFTVQDKAIGLLELLLMVTGAVGAVWQNQSFQYYPSLSNALDMTSGVIVGNIAYFMFLFLPILLEGFTRGGRGKCQSWK